MKGYFASLAKQSGLRVSGRKTGARPSPAAADGPVPAPLHRDETVMAPPPIETSRTENRAARGKPAQKADVPKKKSERPSVNAPIPVSSKHGPETVRDNEPGEPGTPAKIETISPEVPLLHDTRNIPDPISAAGKPVSGDDGASPEIIAVEQQKFVEQDTASAIPTDHPETTETSQSVTPQTVEQPRFFVKTAEIIERGETDTADIGSILFQEVREWVAGGPAETGTPAPAPPAMERVTVSEVTREQPEPGTIVIRDGDVHESAEERAPIEEQNFNLSIGTISVIIEDPEKPADPVRVVQNEQPQNAPAGAKREFSRLSRNYL